MVVDDATVDVSSNSKDTHAGRVVLLMLLSHFTSIVIQLFHKHCYSDCVAAEDKKCDLEETSPSQLPSVPESNSTAEQLNQIVLEIDSHDSDGRLPDV